ncbi:MAG TPA: MBL fold metallo-hydrolase [Kofleriaceae bacterium]|nr:MBL fold metallo-hydrolase [Kofleriaceae bacterium]
MDLFVRFWGTRGSIPTPGDPTRRFGGNTSCVEIRIGNQLVICDAGTGLRELGLDLPQRGVERLDMHMFFSHMHWDHIQGFPFFVPAYSPANTLFVYETSPGDDRVQRLLHGQMKSDHFPVSFRDLGSLMVARHFDRAGKMAIGRVRVACFEQHHPGRSFAYAFECDGKKVVYATDNELDQTLVEPARADSHPHELRVIPAPFVDFCRGADLLIADGQYTDEEYASKVGWGHARANTVVDLAVQAGVKQCAIFHHDPLHTDERVDAIIKEGRARARAHGSELALFGAREGLELKL